MILQLQANVAMGPVVSFDGVITLYVRQYGAGNLRLGTDRESLERGVNLPPGAIVDGIPQSAAQNIVQYFWSGDLWLISDVAGPVMVLAPAYALFVDRSTGKASLPADAVLPSEVEGNLSTYQLI